MAIIPSAFFKVACFIDRSGELDVRAFVMTQDQAALADLRGRRMFDYQRYQVSVAEIEQRTGLDFPSVIPERNPLFFNENADARARLDVVATPERIEVDSAAEMRGRADRRVVVRDEEIDVYIAAAMVNPAGTERGGEWVSIINLSPEPVTLDAWTLSDTRRSPLSLSGALGPGEALRVQPVAPLMLANAGGVIVLANASGERVDRVKYSGDQGAVQGRPVIFAYRDAVW